MSYDIYLNTNHCDKCGRSDRGPYLPDPTYNLTPIFDLALTGEPLPNPDVGEGDVVLFNKKTDRPRGLRVLSGRRAGDTITALEKAVGHLANRARHDEFKALAPANGWGTKADAVLIMDELLEAAREYPDHVWEIH